MPYGKPTSLPPWSKKLIPGLWDQSSLCEVSWGYHIHAPRHCQYWYIYLQCHIWRHRLTKHSLKRRKIHEMTNRYVCLLLNVKQVIWYDCGCFSTHIMLHGLDLCIDVVKHTIIHVWCLYIYVLHIHGHMFDNCHLDVSSMF